MIDFTKDTDWFINANYCLRKISDSNRASIDSFFNNDEQVEYNEYNEYNISQLQHKLNSYISSSINHHIILMAGLFDKRNQQLAGIINIEHSTGNSSARVEILLHAQHSLSSLAIKELLIWIIDYTFYCLYIQQIIVTTNKDFTTLVNMLETLAFHKIEQPSSTSKNVATDISYLLHEKNWLNNTDTTTDFNHAIADDYIDKIVKPYFKTAITKPLYSTIVDFRYQTILCTDQSASSIGLSFGDEAIGASYKYYSSINLANWYFGKWYNHKRTTVIHRYARKIFRIQQYVLKTGRTASFVDSLPYDRGICSYLITFIPIFDEIGNVIAIQSIALNYRLAGYHEYIQNLLEQKKPPVHKPQIKLSKREEEVLFLLICGITQEQIAEMLEVKRETIASIIRNQLRVKFALPIASTKLVVETARSYGFPFAIPESLWRPSVIVLEETLADWLKQYNFAV